MEGCIFVWAHMRMGVSVYGHVGMMDLGAWACVWKGYGCVGVFVVWVYVVRFVGVYAYGCGCMSVGVWCVYVNGRLWPMVGVWMYE